MADLSDFSRDPFDCNACESLDDICPYHHGIAEGIEWMSQHLREIADDPERLNLLAKKHATTEKKD